jgi:IclR family pca regulon transcriptional regulator
MAKGAFEQGPDYVQSLARGLRVLSVFGHDLPSPILSEVAARSGLPRAAARRSLLTLQHLGYVGSRGRSFFLTPRVLELGYSYLSSLDLSEMAQQAMELLSQRVDESCSMAVLDGSDVVYVLRVPVRRIMRIALGVGARLPAFTASLGRVIVASFDDAELDAWTRRIQFHAYTEHTVRNATDLKRELKRVRSQGYALTSQELELGLCSIAVPVRAANGRVVAGLNVSMPYSERARGRAVEEILPALINTRDVIEGSIRTSSWLPPLHMTHAND